MDFSKNQVNIQIGEVCFSMKCRDSFTLDWLKSTYSDFLCDKQASIFVELAILESMSLEEIKKKVTNSNFYHKDGIFYDFEKLVLGEYDLDSRLIRVYTEKQLFKQSYSSYYLNQIICRLYYSSYYIRGMDRLNSQIIHSSAVVIDGCGFIFTGPSGIGKTTAAKLCRNNGAMVINDEGNLISKPIVMGASYTVQGIPIIGKLEDKRNLVAPLTCILLLKQSNRTIIHLVDRIEAVKRLLIQIVGNQFFGQNDNKAILSSKLEFSNEVTQHVPCYELEFALDGKMLFDALQEIKYSGSRERKVHVH